MVYTAGNLLMAALLVCKYTKGQYYSRCFRPEGNGSDRMDWPQQHKACLWGCIDYANAMYTYLSGLCLQWNLIYLCLVLLTMCGKKRFSIGEIWYGYCCFRCGRYLYYRLPRIEEQTSLLALNAILCSGGPGADSAGHYYMEEKRRRQLPQPLRFLLPLFVLLLFSEYKRLGLFIWLRLLPALYLYLSWEKKERFLGIPLQWNIIEFFCALSLPVAQVSFRMGPLSAQFCIYTVTVTAAWPYLVICACALFVLLMQVINPAGFIRTGLLRFCSAWRYLFFPDDDVEDGYLAAVWESLLFCFWSHCCATGRGLCLGKQGRCCLYCWAFLSPILRYGHPLYDDPYIFELEANEEEWVVHKETRRIPKIYHLSKHLPIVLMWSFWRA